MNLRPTGARSTDREASIITNFILTQDMAFAIADRVPARTTRARPRVFCRTWHIDVLQRL